MDAHTAHHEGAEGRVGLLLNVGRLVVVVVVGVCGVAVAAVRGGAHLATGEGARAGSGAEEGVAVDVCSVDSFEVDKD
jgi:hypothetical protein